MEVKAIILVANVNGNENPVLRRQLMSRKKKENKKIRDSYPSSTLKELEERGLLPKNYHLFDLVDMKEHNSKKK